MGPFKASLLTEVKRAKTCLGQNRKAPDIEVEMQVGFLWEYQQDNQAAAKSKLALSPQVP